MTGPAGWVVVLNGPPRSGKSSIESVIQDTFQGPWLNLGVEIDTSAVTPEAAAAMIKDRLAGPPPTALRRLAAG